MKLRTAYLGHFKYFIIDNKGLDFNMKIDKCVDIVAKILGKPSPNYFFKKFLVELPIPGDFESLQIPQDLKTVEFEVMETIIKPPH